MGASIDDNSGNILVADTNNNVIHRMSLLNGSVLATYGSSGSGSGQLNKPFKVVSHPQTGDIFVLDQGNNRIQVFDYTGKYLYQSPAVPFYFSSFLKLFFLLTYQEYSRMYWPVGPAA